MDLARVDSPLGEIVLAVRDGKLVALEFECVPGSLARRFPGEPLVPSGDPAGIAGRVEAYFQGELRALEGIETDAGGTEFQRLVWRELVRIPVGERRSYSDVARAIGRPSAVRAVGAANGSNPIALVIPCHRVLGKDGSLTGYASGIERKKWLLDHEMAASPQGPLLRVRGAGSPPGEAGGASPPGWMNCPVSHSAF